MLVLPAFTPLAAPAHRLQVLPEGSRSAFVAQRLFMACREWRASGELEEEGMLGVSASPAFLLSIIDSPVFSLLVIKLLLCGRSGAMCGRRWVRTIVATFIVG
jgi:hypothetical protein